VTANENAFPVDSISLVKRKRQAFEDVILKAPINVGGRDALNSFKINRPTSTLAVSVLTCRV
jgi:hypothetical protein